MTLSINTLDASTKNNIFVFLSRNPQNVCFKFDSCSLTIFSSTDWNKFYSMDRSHVRKGVMGLGQEGEHATREGLFIGFEKTFLNWIWPARSK